MLDRDKVQRVAVKVTGRVQGVGFRPFVYNLACRFMLQGFIRNVHDHVRIEVQGWSHDIRQFVDTVTLRPPPLAKIERLEYESLPLEPEEEREGAHQKPFQIEESEDMLGNKQFIPLDVAACDDCLAEMNDPLNRRYLHPFVSCVNCGPRYTILRSLPYDRLRTSMSEFPLCEQCSSEFCDPYDRRFHAQTTACHDCGPKIRNGSTDWLAQAVGSLTRGGCVAIKGVGGFHLACDARNAQAVRTLRSRKHRDEKPLAIMVASQEEALQLCEISNEEMRLLTDRARPIVLLRRRHGAEICEQVSFSSPFLGVMLAYTPMHHLLMQGMKGVPLVMTSANESGQPMAYDDSIEQESSALQSMADLVLTHDRRIETRCDDSVVRVADPDGAGIQILIRRSRGIAPEPIELPFSLEQSCLAVGAQLKNTFALGASSRAILSHHIGDLDEWETYQGYVKAIDHYESLIKLQPQMIVHDCHPEYLSTRYAIERSNKLGIPALEVQHHHAHVASCMADNGLDLDQKVMGVAFDGTGYGLDGKIWGGEFFLGTYEHFERVAHLMEVPMPGGEKAIREPWRMALAYRLQAGLRAGTDSIEAHTIEQMIEKRLNSPMTSSMGRLFDAVAALLGLRSKVSFEGQAAIELETLAMRAKPNLASYPLPWVHGSPGKPHQIDSRPMIRNIIDDLKRGVAGSEIAGRFHESLIQMIVRVCDKLRCDSGVDHVVLSGGVFMSGILLSGAVRSLREHEFQVFFHRQVPPNDGGISLGQLAIAAARLRRENENVFGDSGQASGSVQRK